MVFGSRFILFSKYTTYYLVLFLLTTQLNDEEELKVLNDRRTEFKRRERSSLRETPPWKKFDGYETNFKSLKQSHEKQGGGGY